MPNDVIFELENTWTAHIIKNQHAENCFREIHYGPISAFKIFCMFGSLKESSMFDKKFESDQRAQRYVPRVFFYESFGNLLSGWVYKVA